jgi:hypothetical protein
MLVSTTKSIITKVLLSFIRFYQATRFLRQSCCRFEPSCSDYAISAIQKYGVVTGSIKALKRLLKCHPWGSFGYDEA